MHLTNKRLNREYRTIQAMIGLFCRHRHGTTGGLCPDCASLLAYAGSRLDRCPYQGEKPTCGRCPIHCYKPALRERVREVMRYAGPRMIWRHPVLAVRHILEGRKSGKRVKDTCG